MASLTVLLRHSGKWNDEGNYIDFSIERILIKEYASYNDLVASISNQLGIDLSAKSIKIQYKVEGNSTPMEIHNDMGYKMHVELKKENREFGMYSLCITTIKNELVSCGTLSEGDIVQIDESLQRYDSGTNHTLALDLVNSGEAIGVFELNKDLIISKTNQREVIVGQVYKDKATLKEVMENYAISQRFQFRVDRSNDVSYALLCISEDCEWRFKAASINKSELFKVRKFIDNHTCPLKDNVYKQRQACSSLIGGMIRPKRTNHKRKYTPKDIIDDVKSDLGVDVSYMLAWRAKEKAMNFLRDPLLLWMEVTENLYYTGTFVSASTLDGAAYGVIDSENDAAWTWFFEQFKIAYGDRENMCIVSDRNESIIKSVSRVYPDVPHFACIWHLWNNVYKKFKKSHAKLSEIYFSMAKAYTQAEFDSLMEKLENIDIRVKEYLDLAGYEKWARLYAPVNRGWTMTSNIAESINVALVSARELPIYDFLERVKKMFGRWNCSNRKEATQTYTTLGKKYQEMLTLNEAVSTRMTVVPSTEYLHTVNDGGRHYTVCLLERKCVCGRFQVDELPFPHAWTVLKSKFLMLEEYCSNYYKTNSIVMTYDMPLYPLPDRNDWNIPAHVAEEVVLPPKWKIPPRRPKKKRDKPLSELLQLKNQHSCSICGQGGHNKRTCRNAPRSI
ncbi:uncharacterized protein [Nicotiana sylvestris]|uniref:uncharacterized protein n=1 Tax=Nicotiana sylvestris TaxID=4096 RepID=UPI0007B9F25D|nr:PREDICTED: uncharacterized protein LOC107794257 [Nicotiana tabacum]